MTTDTGKPLTGQARATAWRELATLGTTARYARQLAESDKEYTDASLLEDIAAMEAILRRLRRAVSP